jgi:hypothetical protein
MLPFSLLHPFDFKGYSFFSFPWGGSGLKKQQASPAGLPAVFR